MVPARADARRARTIPRKVVAASLAPGGRVASHGFHLVEDALHSRVAAGVRIAEHGIDACGKVIEGVSALFQRRGGTQIVGQELVIDAGHAADRNA